MPARSAVTSPTRRHISRALALALLLAGGSVAAQDAAPPAPPTRVAFLETGSLAGVYFPVGVALCRLSNQHRARTGLRCAAEPSAGSVANIESLRAGKADFALAQSDTQLAALNGTGDFANTGAFGDLRAVMALYPEPLTILARADAGIGALADLRGKRVAIGLPGSGQRGLMERLTAALGWGATPFAETPDIAPEGLAKALCDGRIDGFAVALGHPALVIQEATGACAARLIPVAGPEVDALVSGDASLRMATIPAGLYRGNAAAVPSFGPGATLLSRAGASEEEVYTVVAGIFGDFDMLTGLNPALRGMERAESTTEGLAAPLHPGAERYFREQGLLR